jgi:hypothetical protein
MTLILTQISKYGIVHASDSNLTAGGGTPAGESQKTFGVKYLDAGLTVAGSYSVGGVRMNHWMNDFIQEQANAGISSLSDFSHNLGSALEAQMSRDEKSSGSMVHIAGYVPGESQLHPEFWFVRNVTGIDPHTGEYTGTSPSFQITEDFWTRDCPKQKLMEAFQTGSYQIYVNGFASGRIGFVFLQRVMNHFFYGVWNNPNWAFRPPCSIEENELLVELNVQIIGTLFQLSEYPAPFIGGDIQTYAIRQPANTATVSPPLLERGPLADGGG